MKRIEHNVLTGEVIEIEMTQEEIDAFNERNEADKAAKESASSTRQALLDKLGITEEEARLLLS